MQVGERHVLTIEDLPLILKALNTLSTGLDQGGEALGTLKKLEEFAKEGCGNLILNLNTIEEPLSGTPKQEVRNIGARLVGGVLVVTCQVTSREALRIKVLTRRHSLPKHLISSFDALFSSAAARLRTAVSRMGSPKSN